MSILGLLAVKLLGDTSHYQKSMNDAKKETVTFKKSIINQSKEIEKAKRRLVRDLGNIAKAGKSLTAFVTLPLLGLGGVAVKTAGDFEQYSVALETMLGSTEKAKNVLSELEKFSAKTPLQLPQVIKTTNNLIAFGISSETVVTKLKSLGNAARGNADTFSRLSDAYGKVKVKGKASLEELNRFMEAGVPILDELSNMYGITTEEMFKMVSAGKIGFNEVDQALTNLTTGSGKFAGMMEKQSATLLGSISTMSDNIGLALKDLGTIALSTIKDIVGSVTKWIQTFRDLDTSTKETILKIALFTAGIGPMVLGISRMIKFSMTFGKTLKGVGASLKALKLLMVTNPFLLLATAVIGLSVALGVYIHKTTSTKTITKDLNKATRDLSETQEKYKEVVKQLNDKTQDLNESERFGLEIRKKQLALKMQDNIERIAKAYDNLNKKRFFKGGKSTFEADKQKLENITNVINDIRQKYKDAEKSGKDFVKITNHLGTVTVQTLEMAANEIQYYEKQQRKLKKTILEANKSQIEGIDQVAKSLYDQIITEKDLWIIKTKYPELYNEILDRQKQIGIEKEKEAQAEKEKLKTKKEEIKAVHELSKEEQKLAQQRLSFEAEWQNKVNQQSKNHIQLLEIEKKETLKKARALYKEKKKLAELENTIIAYYENEKLKTREEFETEYNNKLQQLSGDRVAILEIEKQEALKKAEELGADKSNIIAYYDKVMQEAQDKTKKGLGDISGFFSSTSNSVANAVAKMGDSIKGAFTDIFNASLESADGWKKNLSTIVTGIGGVFEAITTVVSNATKQMFDDRLQQLYSAAELETQAVDEQLQAELEKRGLAEETKQEQLQTEIEELQNKLATETDENEKAQIRKTITEKQNELERTKLIEQA